MIIEHRDPVIAKGVGLVPARDILYRRVLPVLGRHLPQTARAQGKGGQIGLLGKGGGVHLHNHRFQAVLLIAVQDNVIALQLHILPD